MNITLDGYYSGPNCELDWHFERWSRGMGARLQQELIAVWEEFEAGETAEARFARSMDRLEPLLQNVSNEGGTWKEFDVDYSKVYEKKEKIRKGSATLWAYASGLIEDSVARGILKKEA